MSTFGYKLMIVVIGLTCSLTNAANGSFSVKEQKQLLSLDNSYGEFSGNVRFGYLSINEGNTSNTTSSAIGGELNYQSSRWHGLNAAGSVYTTQKLINENDDSFFSSKGDSYTILGQAYLQANIAATEIKVGRFGFDSPFADMDDIRMVPNTFSGILITNSDITDSVIYMAHLDKWSGVDTDIPESFIELNGSDGVNVFGFVYQGLENIALQTWYYNANDLANFFYLEAKVVVENLSFAVQYAKQSDLGDEQNGPNGDVYGISASYTLNDFTFSSSYNQVSGIIINGFGSGPFFTSAADHTIADVAEQKAIAVGLEYTGIDNLTLGLLNVAFAQGTDEIDVFVSYDFGSSMKFDFIYHHLHQDGDMILAMFNVGF